MDDEAPEVEEQLESDTIWMLGSSELAFKRTEMGGKDAPVDQELREERDDEMGVPPSSSAPP